MPFSTTPARNLCEAHQTETMEAEKMKTIINKAKVILNIIADVQSKWERSVRTCGILECAAETEKTGHKNHI